MSPIRDAALVLADGSTFDEVARANSIAIRETAPITATGATQSGQPLPPEVAPLLRTAFEMAEDEDPVVETLGGGESYAVLDIGRIVPAAPPPLAHSIHAMTAYRFAAVVPVAYPAAMASASAMRSICAQSGA